MPDALPAATLPIYPGLGPASRDTKSASDGWVKKARRFDGTNLSASQFGRKTNKNDLPSLALKQQQKSFVNCKTRIDLFIYSKMLIMTS